MPSERERFGLLLGLALLVTVLHVAHATGLRNTIAAGLTLWVAAMLFRGRHWPPLAAALLGWLGFCALSAAWSVDPQTTLKSTVYDILMPAGAFYGALLAMRRTDAQSAICFATALGLAFLLAITMLAYGLGQADLLRVHDPTGVAYYYPGPGAASTLAVYAVPTALLVAFDGNPRLRPIGYASLACVPVIGLGNQNRMFWLALAAAVAVFALWQWQRFSARHRRVLAVGLVAAAVAAVAAVSYLTAKRGDERRFTMWREWSAVAADAPFLGYGFGKKVIAEVAAPRLSRAIVEEDRNVLSHSHNLLLNVVLQVGLAGLALFLALLGALARLAYRARDPARLASGAALVALIVAMLVKNATDDMMDHAVIIAFWAYAGLLAGRLAPAQRPETR